LFLGSTYYAMLAAQWAKLSDVGARSGRPRPSKLAAELARSLILATVIAGLASRGDIDTAAGGLLLGVALWVGFPFILWIGAILWENTPWRLAALHAGDWLVKLLVVGVIVSAIQ
jgi:hypothetical protein